MKHIEPQDQLAKALADSKDIELPMDAAFYDRLHAKIMAGIPEKPPAPSPWYERPRRYMHVHLKSWVSVGTGLAGLAIAAQFGAQVLSHSLDGSHAAVAARQEDRFLEEAVQSPEDLSNSVLVSQSGSEFFVDVASLSIENLSAEKLNRLMSKDSKN